jgi:hypothetical protein
LNISKITGIPDFKGRLSSFEFLRENVIWRTMERLNPSIRNNLTTRRIKSPKFLKYKRARKREMRGDCI